MKIVLLLSLLIAPLFVLGQNSIINGRVSSEDSGDPITGALISLKKEGAVVMQLYTDSKGYYTIANIAKGVYTVEVKKAGYAKIIITEIDLDHPQQLKINPVFEYGSYDPDDVLEISYKDLQRGSMFGVAK